MRVDQTSCVGIGNLVFLLQPSTSRQIIITCIPKPSPRDTFVTKMMTYSVGNFEVPLDGSRRRANTKHASAKNICRRIHPYYSRRGTFTPMTFCRPDLLFKTLNHSTFDSTLGWMPVKSLRGKRLIYSPPD